MGDIEEVRRLTLPECRELLETVCRIDLKEGAPPGLQKQLDEAAAQAILAVLRAIKVTAERVVASGEDPR